MSKSNTIFLDKVAKHENSTVRIHVLYMDSLRLTDSSCIQNTCWELCAKTCMSDRGGLSYRDLLAAGFVVDPLAALLA